MKYIVLDNTLIFFFGPPIRHDQYFARVSGFGEKCTGAGFVHIREDGTPTCYGRSDSLDIDSNPKRDTFLAEIMLEGARVIHP